MPASAATRILNRPKIHPRSPPHTHSRTYTHPLPHPCARFAGAGLDLASERIAGLLSKMQLAAQAVEGGKAVRVQVPITRSDVLHGEAQPRPAREGVLCSGSL